MNPSRKISVVFVLPLLALVGCTTTVRQNPNFAARRSHPDMPMSSNCSHWRIVATSSLSKLIAHCS